MTSQLPEAGRFDGYGEDRDDGLYEEVRRRVAYLTALNTATKIGEIEERVYASIDEANKEVDRGISDTLEGRGYRSG